jgi:hypothetical protein
MAVVICTITLFNNSIEGTNYEIHLISELFKSWICMDLHSFINNVLLFFFILSACQQGNQRIYGTTDQEIEHKIDQGITY